MKKKTRKNKNNKKKRQHDEDDKVKMKKINEAGKRGLLITCPPCTRPQKITKEVLLKVHKVWLFLGCFF